MDEQRKSTVTAPEEAESVEEEEGLSTSAEGETPEQDVSFRLDLETLLAPIPGDNPAGEFLRYEGTYDRIQEARHEEANLPQGIWERELKKADWNMVCELCLEALERRTKDLQIAVWLMESLTHLYGFSSLRDGLKLLLGLCEGFWDSLYPEIEGDDLEGRVSPVAWMNEKLYLTLKLISITQPESIDAVPYTWADWEYANYIENKALKDKKVREDAESRGKVTRAKFLGSAMFTSKEFYGVQSESIAASVELTRELEHFLDERCGKQAPSLKQFRDTLEDIYKVVNDFLMEKKEEDENHENSATEEGRQGLGGAQEGEAGAGRSALTGAIRSRTEAYRMLSEAADYLLMHEPHSPTPYLVKRAVSWGNMTLNELLQELVAEEHDLEQIYKLLGMKGPIPQ
jgi:type VI secretion system protein ImpA